MATENALSIDLHDTGALVTGGTEVAKLVCFLASPLASYLTGTQFYADGGNIPVI